MTAAKFVDVRMMPYRSHELIAPYIKEMASPSSIDVRMRVGRRDQVAIVSTVVDARGLVLTLHNIGAEQCRFDLEVG